MQNNDIYEMHTHQAIYTTSKLLFINEIMSLCLATSAHLLAQIRNIIEDNDHEKVMIIDQTYVMLKMQISATSLVTSPTPREGLMSCIKILSVDTSSPAVPLETQPIFCLSEECIKINDRQCSCLFISALRKIINSLFKIALSLMDKASNINSLKYSQTVCDKSILDLGEVLDVCSNEEQHCYRIASATIAFQKDNCEQQYLKLNIE